MDLSDRLLLSYYEHILPINERHKVYLVRHRETGRLYVKKILDIYSADVYRNLQRHPVEGIPRIIASCEENGRLIVIEEFISGSTLRDKIELARKVVSVPEGIPPDSASSVASSAASAALPDGPASDLLTIPEIGLYMIRLCGILERLHSFDPPVIHRDIKPSNIMITGSRVVYLLDLNAARHYSGSPSQEADTRLLGTHGYAAPEQYGFRESSPRTDIFSVGRTLKEAVSALPYEDHTFDAVVSKCTQMDPSKRYASAGDLKAAIVKCLKRYLRKRSPKDPGLYDCVPGYLISDDRSGLAPLNASPYLPPGFRTLNPRNMALALIGYAFIAYFSITMEIERSSTVSLWYWRICFLLIFLLDSLIANDYLGILRFSPLSSSPNRFVRALGAVLMMMAVSIALFLTALLIEEFVFVH